MSKEKLLKDGQWFMYSADYNDTFPANLKIYEGDVHHRRFVRTITKMQALALLRHYDSEPNSYKDGNGRWCEVRVCGDVSAWFGD